MKTVAENFPARTDDNGRTWYRPPRRDGESMSQWGWTSDPAQADPSYVPASETATTATSVSAAELVQLGVHPEYAPAERVGDLWITDFSERHMAELIADIRVNGIRDPLVVRREESGECWLRDGHHRAVAALALGMSSVPATWEGAIAGH